MRRVLFLMGFVVMLLVVAAPDAMNSGCAPVHVAVEIVQQPQGGQNVNTLSCTFKGTFYYGDTMTIEAVWMTENGPHKTESFTFTKDNDVQTLTTSFSAPAGQFLDKTFWVKFNNVRDAPESDKAVCTVQ